MELAKCKQLKTGTPVKVVYRKFPYIGKFCKAEFGDVCVTFVGKHTEVSPRSVQAIDGLTQFK